MSFSDLYNAVQSVDGRVKTTWLRNQTISLTSITRIKEQWTSAIDPTKVRGFYVEGPMGPPVPLLATESMIVLWRDLDKPWRRLVYTKELMHAFDKDDEKTDDAAKLDAQAEAFTDSTTTSPQFMAENKAVFRAVAVLCPEALRQEYSAKLKNGETDLEEVSNQLILPPSFSRLLFREDYDHILEYILQ